MSDAFQNGAFQGGAFQIGGKPPTGAKTLTADAGSYAVTGTNATLRKGWVLIASAGTGGIFDGGIFDPGIFDAGGLTYSVIGTAATLTKAAGAKVLTADAGSYSVTGQPATLRHGWKVSAAAGSYALTGVAAGLKHGWKVGAAAGTYGLTGTAATLRHGWKVGAGTGSYSVTGQDATLTKTSVGKRVTAEQGAYNVTGTEATLVYGSSAVTGGGYAWKGPAEPKYRVHPDYEDKPKQKKRRKVTEPEVITLAPDLHIQTGIVPVRPAWDVMAEIQQKQAEAEEARRAKLRAIALADDDWLMVA